MPGGYAGIGAATVASSARDAVEGADVVLSAASFLPPPERQTMTNDWLTPHALVVPIDYATYCAAEVARDASLFLVDHTGQFLANRDAGNFDGYPEPAAMLGEALAAADAATGGPGGHDAPGHGPCRRGLRGRGPGPRDVNGPGLVLPR